MRLQPNSRHRRADSQRRQLARKNIGCFTVYFMDAAVLAEFDHCRIRPLEMAIVFNRPFSQQPAVLVQGSDIGDCLFIERVRLAISDVTVNDIDRGECMREGLYRRSHEREAVGDESQSRAAENWRQHEGFFVRPHADETGDEADEDEA
jgi:hypothetical protein